MKWYVAISSFSSLEYLNMLETAIVTCTKNTKFKPNLVCDKKWDPVEKLKDKYGINVIYHNGEIFSTFVSKYKDDSRLTGIAGTYLRAEVPLVEESEDFVLYTDADVIFNNPNIGKIPIPVPEYFAAAPEFDTNNWSYFNAGCMLMNVKNLKKDYRRFADYVIPNFEHLFNHAHDQGAYNYLYSGLWTRLPPEYNWKPNWGINEKAVIIHFHGPKPKDIQNYFNNTLTHVKVDVPVDGLALYRNMIKRNPASCEYYLKKYNEART